MLFSSWILCISMLLANALHFIDLPINNESFQPENLNITMNTTKPPEIEVNKNAENVRYRRNLAYRQLPENNSHPIIQHQGVKQNYYYEDDKDSNLKVKISTLVLQTMHDTDRRLKSVDGIKQKYHDTPPYKIGFVLSLIKKSRDIMNELFNVAIKHREKWKALEELKIFELIVHTNVDTTNLVRQLVEQHVNYLNLTSMRREQKRVLLL